jgi:hypothetical protein
LSASQSFRQFGDVYKWDELELMVGENINAEYTSEFKTQDFVEEMYQYGNNGKKPRATIYHPPNEHGFDSMFFLQAKNPPPDYPGYVAVAIQVCSRPKIQRVYPTDWLTHVQDKAGLQVTRAAEVTTNPALIYHVKNDTRQMNRNNMTLSKDFSKKSSFGKSLHQTVLDSTKGLIDWKDLGFLRIVLCPGLELNNPAFDQNLEPTDDEMDMDDNPQTNLSKLRERHQWGMYLGAEECRGFLGAEITNLNAMTSLRTRDEGIDLEHKYALGKMSLY